MNYIDIDREDQRRREAREHRRALRMRRDKKKKMLIGFALVLVVSILLIPQLTIKTNANDGYKYYTDIIIQPGDNLWKIANKYADPDHYKDISSYIAEVKHINHIENDSHIVSGQMLIIPYYVDEYIY
ncbi:MAG: LysM peptidoglycan-binding domain-containing protein [Acetatifactor sp.]